MKRIGKLFEFQFSHLSILQIFSRASAAWEPDPDWGLHLWVDIKSGVGSGVVSRAEVFNFDIETVCDMFFKVSLGRYEYFTMKNYW